MKRFPLVSAAIMTSLVNIPEVRDTYVLKRDDFKEPVITIFDEERIKKAQEKRNKREFEKKKRKS